jgi:hypothetical protein
VNSKWPKLMLTSGITSAWLLYEMATATEAPSRALAILQYGLLACALIGLVGSLAMLASEKRPLQRDDASSNRLPTPSL